MISFAGPSVRPRTENRGACPTFFRACCIEASRGSAHGSRVGYDHPGYHLTIHIAGQQPWDVEGEAWGMALDELCDWIQAGDDDEIINWFCHWLPRCMALVPKRRRKMFVRGVYQGAVSNGWIDECNE